MATATNLTRRDYESALRLVGDAGCGGAGFDEVVSTLLAGIPGLVASELTTLSICDLAHGRRTVVSRPSRAIAPAEIDCFNRFFEEHPLVRYHGTHRAGGTWRISDSVAFTDFRRTGLYNEYYRMIGIDHAMAMPVVNSDDLLVSIVLNRRGRDFADRDRRLLDALRRPVAGLFRAARALAEARTSAAELFELVVHGDWCALVVDAAGRIREATPGATGRLARFLPGEPARVGARLPAAVAAWLAGERDSLRGLAATPRAPLRLERPGRAVEIHAVQGLGGSGRVALLFRDAGAPDLDADPATRSLSAREREILEWLAKGKSNADIGAILGISARTVQKHLEHVYAKLGVESRLAAANRFRELVPRPPAAAR